MKMKNIPRAEKEGAIAARNPEGDSLAIDDVILERERTR